MSILAWVFAYFIAIPNSVASAWVTEKILPSWLAGTHLDMMEVEGVLRLPLGNNKYFWWVLQINSNFKFLYPIPKCRQGNTEVHVPPLGCECKDQPLLDATDEPHYANHTVVNQEHVAEEWHHYEVLDSNVNTLKS